MGSASMSDGKSGVILPVFFSLGLFALIVQVVLLRELMVVAWGNELSFGIGLGQWLLGVFAGAMFGARLTEKSSRPFFLFVFMLIFADILAVVGVLWIRGMPVLAGVMPGAAMAYGQVILLAAWPFVLVGFAVGFSFPAAVSVRSSGSFQNRNDIFPASTVYIVEGAGSFIGSLLFTFLLAGRVSTIATLGWGGLILFFPLFIGQREHRLVRGFALLMLILNISLLLVPGRALSDWSIRQRWKGTSSLKLVESTDSRFQNIEVGKQGGQFQLFEGGRFSFSFPGDPGQRVLAAHLMAQHPGPKRVLVLGTVLDGLGTELLRYPVTKLDSVVLDLKVVKFLHRLNHRDWEQLEKDPRFHEIIEDGRRFVRSLAKSDGGRYDLVYLNQPEPVSTLLNRYYTVEFFRDISRVLAPGGVISLKMASTVNYTSGDLGHAARILVATVRAVFPHIVISPESPHMIFASMDKNSVSSNPAELAARYRRFKLKPAVMALMFRSLYPAERTCALMEKMQKKGSAISLNSDNFPVLSLEFARLTGWYSGSRIAGVLKWLRQAPWLWVVLLLLFASVSLVFAGRPRPSALIAVGAMGFSAMALELVAVYVFQSDVGMVYGKVGLLIGLFMTGLPLGAWWGDRSLRRYKVPGKAEVLLRAAVLSMIALVSIFLLIQWGGVRLPAAGFYLLMAADGFFTGLVFPAAVAVTKGRDGTLVSAAGLVDALDHGGGAVGAMVTGGFLLLLLGVPVTLLFLLGILGVALWNQSLRGSEE
ncbi:MAG: hypothetical protein GXO70_04025 [Acidobacteria bacterium]|nr:hypothetical protein [Acidobacteriota bacterium]